MRNSTSFSCFAGCDVCATTRLRGEKMSTEGLTPRAASLLRTLVGMHIREGQPVGSKALHVESGMSVSTATIRNVMSDLEERGLLSSPHTSAGRIPTAQGYRLFVDSLLQTSPIDASALQALKHWTYFELRNPEERIKCPSIKALVSFKIFKDSFNESIFFLFMTNYFKC